MDPPQIPNIGVFGPWKGAKNCWWKLERFGTMYTTTLGARSSEMGTKRVSTGSGYGEGKYARARGFRGPYGA